MTYEDGYRHGHNDGYKEGYADGITHKSDFKRAIRESKDDKEAVV